MITKELEATKKCCLYASDFHLEMILVPYIKEKNKKLNELMKDNTEIIDCFNISDSETNVEEIQYKYKEFINTSTLN